MKVKSLAPIALLFVVGACSASGELDIAQSKSEPIRPNSTVSFDVFALAEAGSEVDVDLGIDATKDLLFETLEEDSNFASVVSDNGSSDYQMEVQLSEVNVVAPSAQFWLGAFAGAHSIAANVKVVDNSNGLEVTSFTARGDSAVQSIFSIWTQSHTFDAAVEAFGEKVVEGII